MSAIDRVKIMVLGDSGVGKTSFVNLVAHGEPLRTPGWTVGCSVEVKLHEYKEGYPNQTTFFLEFWDIGGSSNHEISRQVFYDMVHGIILVHDLTNIKSKENLNKWLYEFINREDCNTSLLSTQSFDDTDPEKFFGSTQIPILVIGTKLDLVDDKYLSKNCRLANQMDADEIVLDCRQTKYLAAGTTNAVKLTRFYDKVIEQQHYNRSSSLYSGKYDSLSPKFYPTHQD